MKTVAFVLKGYPRVSETFIAQEIFLLEQKGFSIEIFAMRRAREPQRQPIVEKIRAPITYIPEYIWPALFSVLRQNAKVLVRQPFRYLSSLLGAVHRSLRTWNDDPLKRFLQAGWITGYRGLDLQDSPIGHLHSHFVHAPTEMTTYIRELTGIRYSISAHAKDIYTIPEGDVVERVNRSRLIMTCTRFNYEFLRSMKGIDSSKVVKVYHGVDLENFKPDSPVQFDDQFVTSLRSLLSVGRLVPKKGYDIILRALADLRNEGHDFRYDIYGEGELAQALKQKVTELGLNAKVCFHGTTTHPQIIRRLNRGGIFISASCQAADRDRDGIPNTIAEAMAMEIPVIASNVSGIPELVIDGETGWLFDEGDVEDLKRSILAAWSEPRLAYEVSRRGREHVANVFNCRRWIDECAQHLEKAMS